MQRWDVIHPRYVRVCAVSLPLGYLERTKNQENKYVSRNVRIKRAIRYYCIFSRLHKNLCFPKKTSNFLPSIFIIVVTSHIHHWLPRPPRPSLILVTFIHLRDKWCFLFFCGYLLSELPFPPTNWSFVWYFVEVIMLVVVVVVGESLEEELDQMKLRWVSNLI